MKNSKRLMTLILSTIMGVSLLSSPVMAQSDKDFRGKINIGNYSLNAKICGEKSKISVVFESGYGDGLYTYSEDNPNYETWCAVQPEISKFAQTIAYDRAGLGLSDNKPNRKSLSCSDIKTAVDGGTIFNTSWTFQKGVGKTSLDKAIDLHSLLKKTNVKAPYLLVVHSISMLEAVEFAKIYPNEVAGVIDVDGSWNTLVQDNVAWMKQNMPDFIQPYLQQFTAADGTLSEIIQSEQQVQNVGCALKSIPLVTLHADNEGMGSSYQALADEKVKSWLKYSNDSKEIIVPNSGHYVEIDQPQYVIDAIKQMLNKLGNK